jgi:hypothetical protein
MSSSRSQPSHAEASVLTGLGRSHDRPFPIAVRDTQGWNRVVLDVTGLQQCSPHRRPGESLVRGRQLQKSTTIVPGADSLPAVSTAMIVIVVRP